jgi:hypothetical protein
VEIGSEKKIKKKKGKSGSLGRARAGCCGRRIEFGAPGGADDGPAGPGWVRSAKILFSSSSFSVFLFLS